MDPAGPKTILRFRRPNGLTVTLAPIPASATASVWVWYPVGSKNEGPGMTGASHWLEHMLFKGSTRYARGAIDRAIVRAGGTLNAFTDSDFTAYFATVPREAVALPLDVEADRMVGARIDPREVERERTVVLSEREGAENWPEFLVAERLHELAFRHHPYRWDALGYPEDIRAMGARELRAYYERWYGPRNAHLVVAGGFDPTAMRHRIEAAFDPLPRRGEDPTVRVHEALPRREMRDELHGPGTTPFLAVGYRAPAADDPMAPRAVVLDVLLGGASRLFLGGRGFGRGGEHPVSRLYRSLVKTGLAVEVGSDYHPRVAPGLFLVEAQAAEGVPLPRLERAVHRVTEALARHGPTPTELARARTAIRRGAELAYEGATSTGFRLGFVGILGGGTWEAHLLQAALRAGPREVREAARTLFAPDHRCVVGYRPDGGST